MPTFSAFHPRSMLAALLRLLRGRPWRESPVLPAGALALDFAVLLWLGFARGVDRPHLAMLHLVFFSLFTLLCFGVDKSLAALDRRRISEPNLLWLSFLGGAPGGILGMVLFRHKNRALRFRVLLPAAVLVDAFAFALLIFA
jgi:uncharacterized membrane protein YsdA (DUF1294 family)